MLNVYSSEIHNNLKLLNRRAEKSTKSEDGDIVDCVDIYIQPAFDHPALQNHKIQVVGALTTEGELRATSLERFGKKNPAPISYSTNDDKGTVYINQTTVELGPQINCSAAILVTTGYSYIGAQGDINIWNPKVESPDEYTTAQIWLKNGPGNAFKPKVPVLNLFLWSGGLVVSYKSTGCFDLTCSGFVQTNKDIALGIPLGPVSSEGGPQYQTTFSINKDQNTGNWWLRLGQNVPVGYWPPSLFSYLKQGPATLVEWGREVYSSKVKETRPHTGHTETGM
ncbi:protein neprosin-like [Rosa rugosa]|uniref:protein neprosin-like n=1 Tax=Rosa rugosa TaxID=74645 RepID=UPI002B4064E7|nr:protein neprosin-like [Rosa rugosa]